MKTNRAKAAKAFTTIEAIHLLEDKGGFKRKQAETQIEVIDRMMHDDLCTKDELHTVENNLKSTIETVRINLENKIETVRVDLENKIDAVKVDLENKIDAVKVDLENKIDAVKVDLENKIDAVKVDLENKIDGIRADIDVMRSDIIVKLGSAICATIGICAMILGILISIK